LDIPSLRSYCYILIKGIKYLEIL